MANQFFSDPTLMSSYIEASFRPRSARPGEVTILVPDLWNPGETLPVHIPQQHLVNVWMALVSSMNVSNPPPMNPNNPAALQQQNLSSTWSVFRYILICVLT